MLGICGVVNACQSTRMKIYEVRERRRNGTTKYLSINIVRSERFLPMHYRLASIRAICEDGEKYSRTVYFICKRVTNEHRRSVIAMFTRSVSFFVKRFNKRRYVRKESSMTYSRSKKSSPEVIHLCDLITFIFTYRQCASIAMAICARSPRERIRN